MTLFYDSTSSFPSSLASLPPAYPFPRDHHSRLSTSLWVAVQVGRTQQSGLRVEKEGGAFAVVTDGASEPKDLQNIGEIGGHFSLICDSACQDLKTAEPMQAHLKEPICERLMEFGLH